MVGLAMMHAEGSRAQGCSEFGEARVLRPSLLPRWLGLVWAVVRSYAQTAPAFACVHSSSDPNTMRGRTATCAARNGHGCPLGNVAYPTQVAHSSRRSIRTPQVVDRGAAWATRRCFAAHQRRRLPRPPPWLHLFLAFLLGPYPQIPTLNAVDDGYVLVDTARSGIQSAAVAP